jgi:hypothetical protein
MLIFEVTLTVKAPIAAVIEASFFTADSTFRPISYH